MRISLLALVRELGQQLLFALLDVAEPLLKLRERSHFLEVLVQEVERVP